MQERNTVDVHELLEEMKRIISEAEQKN